MGAEPTSRARKIYIAGHRGMVGNAILSRLQRRAESGERLELVTRTHAELDLTDQAAASMPTTATLLILFTKT